MNTKIIVSLGVGAFSVIPLLILSIAYLQFLYVDENDTPKTVFEKNRLLTGTAVDLSVKSFLETGKTEKKIVQAIENSTIYFAEKYNFNHDRAFYAKEFGPESNVFLLYECRTTACRTEVEGKSISFLRNAVLLLSMECEKTVGYVSCKAIFSEPKEEEAIPEEYTYESYGKNSLQKELFRYLQEKRRQVVRDYGTLETKNFFEKVLSLWEGEPTQNLISSKVLFAEEDLVFDSIDPDTEYFYDAQKKYGLMYPNGIADTAGFIIEAKSIAEERKKKYAEDKNRTDDCEGKKFEEFIESQPVLDPQSRPVLAAKGISKLYTRMINLPYCKFAVELEKLDIAPPTHELIYTFPESESEKEQAYRAMVVYAVERRLNAKEKESILDQYPFISFKNQMIWLNKTGNDTAYEMIHFYNGTRIDFGSLRDYISGISIDPKASNDLHLTDYLLTVKWGWRAKLVTKKDCTGVCKYILKIAP